MKCKWILTPYFWRDSWEFIFSKSYLARQTGEMWCRDMKTKVSSNGSGWRNSADRKMISAVRFPTEVSQNIFLQNQTIVFIHRFFSNTEKSLDAAKSVLEDCAHVTEVEFLIWSFALSNLCPFILKIKEVVM